MNYINFELVQNKLDLCNQPPTSHFINKELVILRNVVRKNTQN